MANSKEVLSKVVTNTENPDFDINKTPNSRGFRKIYDNAYKPGFIDKATPEVFKMSVDRELGEISKALFKTGERDSDLSDENQVVKEIVEELRVEVDESSASIVEVKRVVASNTLAIAETKLELEASITDVNAKITTTNQVVANLESSTAQQITNLETTFNDETASIRQELSSVSSGVTGLETKWSITTDVNGKVAGVELMNGTRGSEFNILADKFRVYNGATDDAVFEIVGGKTKIKNAVVGDIYSDNWDGVNTGWGINKSGTAVFNSVKVRGEVNATSGIFDNITINENCIVNASAKIKDAQVDTLQIAGNAVTIPTFKEVFFSPNLQINANTVPYDVGCNIENIYYSDKAEILCFASGLVEGHGPTDFTVRIRVMKDGNIVEDKEFGSSVGNSWSTISTYMTSFTIPSAGTYSFYLLAGDRNTNGYYLLKNISLSVLGAKR